MCVTNITTRTASSLWIFEWLNACYWSPAFSAWLPQSLPLWLFGNCSQGDSGRKTPTIHSSCQGFWTSLLAVVSSCPPCSTIYPSFATMGLTSPHLSTLPLSQIPRSLALPWQWQPFLPFYFSWVAQFLFLLLFPGIPENILPFKYKFPTYICLKIQNYKE